MNYQIPSNSYMLDSPSVKDYALTFYNCTLVPIDGFFSKGLIFALKAILDPRISVMPLKPNFCEN